MNSELERIYDWYTDTDHPVRGLLITFFVLVFAIAFVWQFVLPYSGAWLAGGALFALAQAGMLYLDYRSR